MILLDSDHMTVLRYSDDARCAILSERLKAAGDSHTGTTIITVEEHMRGWLAEIQRRKAAEDQVPVYAELSRLFAYYARWEIAPFDSRAAEEFDHLRKQRVRIGTMDLKIAAIALVNDALLLSANLGDFGKVQGLRVEDWLK